MTIEGSGIIDAYNKSPFKEESISTLSFYTDESSNDRFRWDSKKLEWIKTDEKEIIYSETENRPMSLLLDTLNSVNLSNLNVW